MEKSTDRSKQTHLKLCKVLERYNSRKMEIVAAERSLGTWWTKVGKWFVQNRRKIRVN